MKTDRYRQRGGKADPRNRLWRSAAWKKVRRVVLTRDGHTCVKCGQPGNIVDHIVAVLDDESLWLELDNLQTLCHRCSGAKDGVRAHLASAPLPPAKSNRFLGTIARRQ